MFRFGFIFTASIILFSSHALSGGLPSDDSSKDQIASAGQKTAPTNSTVSPDVPKEASSSSGSNRKKTANQSSGPQNTVDDKSPNNAAFSALEDEPLIVDVSNITDGDGMGEIQIQWQVSSDSKNWVNLAGQTDNSFTPLQEHVGQRLRVQVFYVDGQGTPETLMSAVSSPVQNVNDNPTGTAAIVGVAKEDGTLVVDLSSVDDEDGVGNFEVRWQESTPKSDWRDVSNVQGEILQLGQNQVGRSFRAIISYTDDFGTRESLSTTASEVVVNVDDPVEGEVRVDGEAIEGRSLSVVTDSVSDEDGIASISVFWESSSDGRNWKTIEADNPQIIKLQQLFVGHQLRARVSVVDSYGVQTTVYSKPTNAVQNVNDRPSGGISVRRARQ